MATPSPLIIASVTKPSPDAAVGLILRYGTSSTGGRAVVISKLAATGLFAEHPALKPGMEVVSINGVWVQGQDFNSVVALIRQTTGKLDITLQECTTEQASHGVAIATPVAPTPAQGTPTSPARLQVFGNPALVTTKRTTLTLTVSKTPGERDVFIKDTELKIWFRVRETAYMSTPWQRVLLDAKSKPIWVMNSGVAVFLPPDQDNRLVTKFSHKTIYGGSAEISATVVNQTTATRTLITLKGDTWVHSGKVILDDCDAAPIARFNRIEGALDRMFGIRNYRVTIEPGVDAAMMVTMCQSFVGLINQMRCKTYH